MLDSESTLSYVPNRNAIMAMYAAAYAEMYNYDTVSFGGQQQDSVYPDNNPGFVSSVDELLKYSLNWGTNITFSSPLIHLIKHEIVELGQKLDIDYDAYTCSCYYPKLEGSKIISCHSCGCCQYRDNALKMVAEKKRIKNLDIFIDKYVKPYA
jgi:7-cyano-7-deazaguanine synthase in queuosine biosynthesis